MEALLSVLESVRFEAAVYVEAVFAAPWCRSETFRPERVVEKLGATEQAMTFHYVTEGACKVRLVDGAQALDARAGDLILLPQGDRYLMGSHLCRAPMEANPIRAGTNFECQLFGRDGGGAVTRFVVGYLAYSSGTMCPLLQTLPRALRIPISDGGTRALLRDLLRIGVRESLAERPGTESTLARLAEVMVVEALRRYVDEQRLLGTGWLAGTRDAHVGRALALLHDDPGRAWSVDELARAVALSRSALAGRFVAVLGEPPMRYLTRWRLALAARTLRSGEKSVARVAERSGYESEAAFSRAFKREFGVAPRAWRNARQRHCS